MFLTEDELVSNTTDLIHQQSHLLRQSDNTLIGKINGLDRSVKVYLDNNTIKSINLYPGISNRGNLKNSIINFGEVKW